MHALLRRGLTFYARLTIPEARWEDVGRAFGATKGKKREIVRTLQTTDRREAERRRDAAIAAMREEVDRKLRKAGLKPLSDWTADWLFRAAERRSQMADDRRVIVGYEENPRNPEERAPWTAADFTREEVEDEAAEVEARQGEKAAQAFLSVALGEGMTIADAARLWIEENRGQVREQTLNGHRAAFRRLGDYLTAQCNLPPLEGVTLDNVTRRIAGEFLADRRQHIAPATVLRECSSLHGLWRWAVRREYANANPWDDQAAGFRGRKANPGAVSPRGYNAAELVTLLRAAEADLAPLRGALAPAFWDGMRLAMLTGARANELFCLSVGDIIEDGTALVLAAGPAGGKTANAARIVPLHALAQAVLRQRLATLPDSAPAAPLWPELPPQGADKRRAKTISTRFLAIRQRLLPEAEGVDWHSFRRSFVTFCETAMHADGRLDADLIALLVGHARQGLALSLYSDWTRIGRPAMSGDLAAKLGTLREAVADAIDRGMPQEVRKVLEETAGGRPAVREKRRKRR